MIMNPEKEAQLRIMLKKEGKTHEEINSIVEQFKESERQELEAQAPIQETEPIEETEISEEELKAKLKNLRESKKQERERARQEHEENLISRKHEVLDKIESQLLEKEKTLNVLILENSKLRDELIKQNAEFAKQLGKDRIDAREAYARGLESFFGKVFNTITNFSDSPTEQSLICLFTRQGSTVSLSGILSSKKVITKDEIQLMRGD